MDRAYSTHSYVRSPDAEGYNNHAFGPNVRHLGPISNPYEPGYKPPKQPPLFKLGKLQIAGILLIIVFILGLISAVAIAMFDIHLLALTEFEDDGKSDVYGYVTDEEGEILVNVTVVILGTHHFAAANSDGFYSIENVKEGDYEIEASKEDYGTVTKHVSLNPNSPVLVNFILEDGGNDKTEDERYQSNLSELRHLNYSTAAIIMVYGTIALIGGILAFFRRFYQVAMVGGLCGLVSGVLSVGIIVGPILAIIALVLIVGNQEEFFTFEPSLFDRLRGVSRTETGATTRPTPVSRAQPQKLKKRAAPTKTSSKAAKLPYDQGYTYPSSGPTPIERMEKVEHVPRKITSTISKPTSTCTICKGSVKAESHGIFCQCGASYHNFCAGSLSECRRCGAQL